MSGIYRYVIPERIASFLAMGWIFEREISAHYSFLMRACCCNGDGREPLA